MASNGEMSDVCRPVPEPPPMSRVPYSKPHGESVVMYVRPSVGAIASFQKTPMFLTSFSNGKMFPSFLRRTVPAAAIFRIKEA